MSGFRASASALVLVVVALGLLAPACGTDAVGIDDCRDIEEARCSAAQACGILDDIGECQRFYRDQCLHGLAVRSPGRPAVTRCVEAIAKAEECARSSGDEEGCHSAPCNVVLHPEIVEDCDFLRTDSSPPPDDGSAGAAQGGASGAPAEEPSAGSGGRSPD